MSRARAITDRLDRDRVRDIFVGAFVAPLITLVAVIFAGSLTELWYPGTAGFILFVGSFFLLVLISYPGGKYRKGLSTPRVATRNRVLSKAGYGFSPRVMLVVYLIGCFVVGLLWLGITAVVSPVDELLEMTPLFGQTLSKPH